MKKINWKMLSIVLVLILAFTMIPTTVFASAQTEDEIVPEQLSDAFLEENEKELEQQDDYESFLLKYKDLKGIDYVTPAYDCIKMDNEYGVSLLSDSDKDGYEENNSFNHATHAGISN